MQFDARGLDWASSHCEDDGALRTRLRAVPSGTAPRRSRYHELESLPADEPCVPKNDTVARNLFVADEPPDAHERVRADGTVAENWTATTVEEMGLRDAADPAAGLADGAPPLEVVPGVERLRVEHAGRP